MIYTIFLDKKI